MCGGGVRILYDVKIGKNCIIGAGSVVTKNIPDNSIAVGNLARVIGDIKRAEEKYEKYSLSVKNIDLQNEDELEKFFWNK